MTPAQLLATIRNQVYETEAAFYTDAEIYSYMWQAEQEIARVIRCTETVDSSTSTVADTEYYSLPSNAEYVYRVEWDGKKLKKIDFTDRDTVDFNQYGSTLDTGRPTFYYLWGNQIGLYPVPDQVKVIKFYYYAIPTVIDENSTALTIPSWLGQYIVDYALYRMYAKDQDDGRASFHRQQWEANLIRAQQSWSKRQSTDNYYVVRDTENYPETELGII